MRVTVLVNGQREEVRTERDTALLYVLRNHLGLTGTRFGCGLGLCGACLVLIDGRRPTSVTRRCGWLRIGT
jgi:nicotinate dehydrogenase subunit A